MSDILHDALVWQSEDNGRGRLSDDEDCQRANRNLNFEDWRLVGGVVRFVVVLAIDREEGGVVEGTPHTKITNEFDLSFCLGVTCEEELSEGGKEDGWMERDRPARRE
jgi:hypothetical protein